MSRDIAFRAILHVRQAMTQILQSSLYHLVPCADFDQTARIRRLIEIFARRTTNLVGNVMPRVKYSGLNGVTSHKICEKCKTDIIDIAGMGELLSVMLYIYNVYLLYIGVTLITHVTHVCNICNKNNNICKNSLLFTIGAARKENEKSLLKLVHRSLH